LGVRLNETSLGCSSSTNGFFFSSSKFRFGTFAFLESRRKRTAFPNLYSPPSELLRLWSLL
jgi:hypothetical protein